MEKQTEIREQVVETPSLTDEENGSSVNDAADCPSITQSTVAASSQIVEQVVENEQLDGSMAPISQPQEPPPPALAQVPDVYEGSPVASVQSGASVELEETFGSPSQEGRLTPATDNSSTTKSLPGSGRVTPASQSDQSLYMSSSEKGTPVRRRRVTDSGGRQIDFDNQSSSSGSVRSVRFPLRAGILWKKGERLEAMDFMHKWFPAKIREINEEELTVLIHFDGWNQRFDEWVDMASDRIRPLIRHSERKEKLKRQALKPDYKIGEQVYAKWTDCKMYPAKITGHHPNGSYEVIFYDGFKKQVQPINLRPMPGELKTETFEVSPVTASIPKKQKVRRESGTATSPTDGIFPPVASPPIPKVKKEPRSRSKSMNKQRSRKNKVIPMEQFVTLPKDVSGFKADGTDPMDGTAVGLGIKSEPVSTQTEYAEQKMEIKEEPMSPIPTVVSDVLQPDQAYIKPPTQEKAHLHGPPVLPPKAFVVEPDHNRYKCTVPGCGKSFRKEHLLEYHIKYYHVDGMSGPPPPQPQKRRRKTTSICSTESDSTPSSSRKSSLKKPRHSSAENFQVQREIKQEVKEEMGEDTAIPLLTSIKPKQETGEISTQTTLLKQEASVIDDPSPTAGADLESSSLHQRTMSQESMLTEESSVTDAEEFLKPDELVNCICDFYEENGLMIQCEVCMCWQHASCFGITERTLPKTYVCFVCENPPGVRESSRYIHEQDWLKCGELPAFSYLPNVNGGEERCANIKQTHTLVAEIHQLNAVMHSLKLQLKILRSKDESKLKLWRMDWDVTETFQEDDTSAQIDNTTNNPETNTGETTNNTTKVTFTLSTGDDSREEQETVDTETAMAASSEMKQEAMYETDSLGPQNAEVKQGNGVQGENGGKEGLEQQKTGGAAGRTVTNDVADSTKACVDSAGVVSTKAGVDSTKTGEGSSKAGEQKVEAPAMTATDSGTKISNQLLSPGREGQDGEEGTHSDSTESVVEDPTEMYERNLLSQIQRVQADLADRMDRIEEQLAVLESMESVGTRRVPSATDDVTADMPQLKRSMKTLYGDLHKVKKMAVFH